MFDPNSSISDHLITLQKTIEASIKLPSGLGDTISFFKLADLVGAILVSNQIKAELYKEPIDCLSCTLWIQSAL